VCNKETIHRRLSGYILYALVTPGNEDYFVQFLADAGKRLKTADHVVRFHIPAATSESLLPIQHENHALGFTIRFPASLIHDAYILGGTRSCMSRIRLLSAISSRFKY